MTRLTGQGTRRSIPLGFVGLLVMATFLPLLVAESAEAARPAIAPESLPTARLGAVTIAAGEHGIFIIGGRNETHYLRDILRYDPGTGRIERWGQLPNVRIDGQEVDGGRQSATAVWTGSEIYVFGGAVLTTSAGISNMPRSTDQIVRIDPATRTVAAITEKFYGASAAGAASGAFGASAIWVPSSTKCPQGCAYVFGGFQFVYPLTPQRLTSMLRFTPSATERLSLFDGVLPYPLQDAAAVWSESAKTGYLYGGLARLPESCIEGREQYVCASDEILRFDATQERVTVAPELLRERTQFAAAAVDGDTVYVFGGRRLNGTASDLITVHNPARGSISELPLPLPSPRFAFTAAPYLGKIYLAGGRDAIKAQYGGHEHGFTDIIAFTPGVTEPTAPRDVRADQNPEFVNLSWRAPVYDGGQSLNGYRILREADDGIVTEIPVSASATSYTDRDVLPGRNYTYTVLAVNVAGPGARSAPIPVSTGFQPPGPVQNLEAAGGDGTVVLRWDEPANDGGRTIIKYQITRIHNGTSLVRNTTNAHELAFIDANLENGQAYTYLVRAVNELGVGADPATPVTAVPRPVPAVPQEFRADVLDRIIHLNWYPPTGSAPEAYRIYRYSTGTEPDWVQDVDPASGPTFEDEDGRIYFRDLTAEPGVAYQYVVSAKNSVGEGPRTLRESAAIIVPPVAPKNVVAIPRDGGILVRWDALAPTEMGGASSVSYLVERFEAGEWRIVGTPTATAYRDDDDIVPGTTYHYAVRAVNSDGTTSYRSERASAPEVVAKAPTPNTPPEAALVLVKTTGAIGERLTFDASYSRDVDEEDRVVEYWFDFGDGANSGWVKTPTVTHSYAENAVAYHVSVKVKDTKGAESKPSPAQAVTIGALPVSTDTTSNNYTTIPNNPAETSGGFGFVPVPAWVSVVALAAAAGLLALARRQRG